MELPGQKYHSFMDWLENDEQHEGASKKLSLLVMSFAASFPGNAGGPSLSIKLNTDCGQANCEHQSGMLLGLCKQSKWS